MANQLKMAIGRAPMPRKQAKPEPLTDQLRDILNHGPVTRQRTWIPKADRQKNDGRKCPLETLAIAHLSAINLSALRKRFRMDSQAQGEDSATCQAAAIAGIKNAVNTQSRKATKRAPGENVRWCNLRPKTRMQSALPMRASSTAAKAATTSPCARTSSYSPCAWTSRSCESQPKEQSTQRGREGENRCRDYQCQIDSACWL